MPMPRSNVSRRQVERVVAAIGSVNDPLPWSGIPFHLLQAGKEAGLLDRGLDLESWVPALRTSRWWWNTSSVLSGGGSGGFQYSESFLDRLWAQARPRAGTALVNCFQLLPEHVVNDPQIDSWFFIDQTLTQLFDYYEERSVIGHRIATEAISREASGYAAARGVIVTSRWAKEDVVNNYGIDPAKVHVVIPGPSLDLERLDRLTPPGPRPPVTEADPLRLVLVGKEWRRKGLDRLLRAIGIARSRGAPVTLRVIGCSPTSLPGDLRPVAGVEWAGFVSKKTDEDRFITLVRDCDVGCLLSRSEAGGIALREYHSLGLAVIGPDTGGSPEHMVEGASIAVAPDAPDEVIADKLVVLACEPGVLGSMKAVSWAERRRAGWRAAMDEWAEFWPYREENR